MTNTYVAAEVFPAGEYLRDELEERGWTVTEFAQILDRPVQAVSEILNGKKEITTETAIALAEALGTSAELWLNLQTAYRLQEQRSQRPPSQLTPVARRARIRDAVPFAEIRSRGWIPGTNDLDEIESAVCTMLEIRAVDEKPAFALAAKRSNASEPVTLEQTAWLGHIRQVAKRQTVKTFNLDALLLLAAALPQIVRNGPSDLPQTPALFADCGVHLVFSEGLRGGKLDGAVTFLPDGSPLIGLTTRGNRFDSVLFTLLHECAHLTLQHLTRDNPTIVDDDLTQEQLDPLERAANDQASAWLFPDGLRVTSTSVPAIMEAAARHQVHASLVVGQVQRETQNWKRHRAHIPKVRSDLEAAGLLS